MTVEIFSGPNLHEKICRTQGSIAAPLDSQATSLPTEVPNLAGNKDNYLVSDEFEIRPDQTMNCGISCPRQTEKSP